MYNYLEKMGKKIIDCSGKITNYKTNIKQNYGIIRKKILITGATTGIGRSNRGKTG